MLRDYRAPGVNIVGVFPKPSEDFDFFGGLPCFKRFPSHEHRLMYQTKSSTVGTGKHL